MRRRGGQKRQHIFRRFRIILVDLSFGNSAKMGRCKLLHPRQVRRRTTRSKAISRTKRNGHFRRQIQSSLASERCILQPKGTTKHTDKNCQAFPLVLRVKTRTMWSASSQQKIDRSFPPFRGLKMAHSDRQVTRKTPKNKLSSISPSFKG